ncbi:MAG: RDD family protein [Candidatus Hydrogenedentes bacterium]|nr:RDD family protein [Candidatus Hydrogenedentota bacterium]
MDGRSSVLTIRTPEGIVFSMQLAGPTTRFLAWAIDLAVVAALYLVLVNILSLIVTLSPLRLEWMYDFANAVMYVLMFVINIGYGIVLEWFWRGQTLGKYVMRLRVIDEQGLRLQFSQIVIRNLLRLVDSLPMFYLVGGIACVLNKKCQRLGDFAANTIVTYTPKLAEPDLDIVLGGKYNSLRDYPHIEARLRQRVSPEEARIALQAVMRRDGLEPKARVELFAELANHFRAIAPFPEEAALGIADEQFVRNVVDCLFRPQVTAAGRGQQLGNGARGAA